MPARAADLVVTLTDPAWNGFRIEKGAKRAELAAVPGETDEMPKGAFLEARNRATDG